MKIANAEIALENSYHGQVERAELRREISIPGTSEQLPNIDQQPLDETHLDDLESIKDSHLYILKLLVQKLSGKEIDWFEPESLNTVSEEAASITTEQATNNRILVERFYHEAQSNNLTLSGNIQLASGESIAFSFKSQFAQEYTSYQRSVESVEMKDPLIISFTNRAVELSNEQMQLDLDADGTKESFAKLAAGYGYLALDINNNGHIDDGSELFGALSGNGFADLAQYDDDGNGFIDEQDAIFSKLKVWQKNTSQDELIDLTDANIGAIALESVATPMNLRSGDKLQGAIRQTGFYIDNQGSAGLMQQIDYVV